MATACCLYFIWIPSYGAGLFEQAQQQARARLRRGRTVMSALADLVARAAAQVAALEAGAPALAAAATCPLRAADLMHAGTLNLLTPLLNTELVLAVAKPEKSGLTLHEARLVYRGPGARVVAMLASTVCRVEWGALF